MGLAKHRGPCQESQAMSMARQTPPSVVRRVRDKPAGSPDTTPTTGDAVRRVSICARRRPDQV